MCPQTACIRGCKVTLVAFVCLFSTVRFQMSPQIACMGRCIITLIAFMWLDDIVSTFLQDFPIWILQTNGTIFKILLHCQCGLCFAQIVAWNWFKFIIYFWCSIITIVHFSMAYFHFFIIEMQTYMWQISCKIWCLLSKEWHWSGVVLLKIAFT